jgi:hypothetical protein
LITPLAPAAVAGQTPAQEKVPSRQPPPQPNTPARQVPRQPDEVPKLDLTEVDLAGAPALHYFTALQFSTLGKLGALLMPPLKNNPGAIEAQAPEFLDFLISVSPADRQSLYKSGLDSIEEHSKEKFQKSFADLEPQQADEILRPLLVARAWPQDLPSDKLKRFIIEVHEDLHTATVNSREWAAASEKTGRRFSRGSRTSGYYWAPIDPISEG